MSSLKSLEKTQFTDLFEMNSGYVLGDSFSNQTFQELVRQASGLDIYSTKYTTHGESKAKRLRSFWDQESDAVVANLLDELLKHWDYKNQKPLSPESESRYRACVATVQRLTGRPEVRPKTEDDFLQEEFKSLAFDSLPIAGAIIPILQYRYLEAQKCLKAEASLATIFLAGSILEGLLLGVASNHPRDYNTAVSSPRDENGKTKQFHNWTLSNLIDVSHEVGFLSLDVKKFGHALRDFRNFIHPYEQLSKNFSPDRHTAEMCLQVLKAAIAGVLNKVNSGQAKLNRH